jgi:preprotein translocase subunit SecG
MIYLFYTIHVLICLFLILVVLLQQGKGADLSVFGGGGTMTAFGARGAATLLHKMTVIGFIGFIVTTLTIGILQKQNAGASVMTTVPVAEESAPATKDEATPPEAAAGALPEDDAGAPPEAEAGAPTEDGGGAILPEAEEFDDGAAAAAAAKEEGGGEDSGS